MSMSMAVTPEHLEKLRKEYALLIVNHNSIISEADALERKAVTETDNAKAAILNRRASTLRLKANTVQDKIAALEYEISWKAPLVKERKEPTIHFV